MDAQKSGALGECSIAKARDAVQGSAVFEASMLIAIGHDVLCNCRINACDTLEECR